MLSIVKCNENIMEGVLRNVKSEGSWPTAK